MTMALGATLTVTGCAAGGPPLASEVDCAAFTEMSDERRTAFIEYDGDGSRTLFTDTGYEDVSTADLWERTCADTVSTGDILSDIDGSSLFGWDAEDPACADFLERPEEVRTAWAAGAGQLTAWSGQAADPAAQRATVERACTADPTGSVTSVVSSIASVAESSPAAYADLLGVRDPASGWAVSRWRTESRLGYSTDVTLTIAPVQRIDVVHPLRATYAPGAACSVDESDAVVPFLLETVDVTTSSVASVVDSKFVITHVPPRRDDGLERVTSLQPEAFYGSGPECSTGAAPTITLQKQSDTGQAIRSALVGFIVVSDYFSPRNPDGADFELVDWLVQPQQPVVEDDAIISLSVSVRTALDGTPVAP